MNDYYNKNKNLFILTPLKFTLCSVINQIIRSTELDCSSKVKLFDILRHFINDYSSELSFKQFLNKLYMLTVNEKQEIKVKRINAGNSNRVDKENLFDYKILIKIPYDYIIELLRSIKFNSIEDVYMFFHLNIKELKYKEESNFYLDNGGLIDHFIRKCLISFYKFSFDDYAKFFESIDNYFKHEQIKIELSNFESELLFERHVQLIKKSDDCKAEFEEIIDKVKNYKQKHYFFAKKIFASKLGFNTAANTKIQSLIDNSHKYFDYNMKYYYSEIIGDNKTHYALLNSAEEYYNSNYYEQSIDILTECIKLDQSNCDHEGLIKCFIWLHKIFRNLGNYEISKKFLTSSLIKSYENNYHLLYMISSMELSTLNMMFGTNLGLINSTSSNYENSYLYNCSKYLTNLKRILQFNSSKKVDNHIFCNFDEYISIYYINVINNLILAGHISLSKNYFLNFYQSLKSRLNHEYICYILHILFELTEFDISFVLKILIDLIAIENIMTIQDNQNPIMDLICLKYFVNGNNINSSELIINSLTKTNFNSHQAYFINNVKLLRFSLEVRRNKCIRNEMINELNEFKSKCKRLNFNKFELESNLLISEILINQERFSEALIFIGKAKLRSKTLNLKNILNKSRLAYAKIFFILKNYEKSDKIVDKLAKEIEKDWEIYQKAEFYILKAKLTIIKNKFDLPSHFKRISYYIYQAIESFSLNNDQKAINDSLNLLYILTIKLEKDNQNFNFFSRYSKSKELTERFQEDLVKLNRFNISLYSNPLKTILSIQMILRENHRYITFIKGVLI